MTTVNAATIYADVLAAIAVAHTDNVFENTHGFLSDIATPLHGFTLEIDFYDDRNYTKSIVYAEATLSHLGGLRARLDAQLKAIQASAIAEYCHATGASHQITFRTSAKGTMRVANNVKRLTEFAAIVKSKAAIFGGGFAKAERKAKPLVTWSTAAIKVACEAMQDNDYAGAVQIAEEKLGGFFVAQSINAHNKNKPRAVLCIAPMPVKGMPDNFVSARVVNGGYQVFDLSSGFTVSFSEKLRSKAESAAIEKWASVTPEKQNDILANAKKRDPIAARAQWFAEYELSEKSEIEHFAALAKIQLEEFEVAESARIEREKLEKVAQIAETMRVHHGRMAEIAAMADRATRLIAAKARRAERQKAAARSRAYDVAAQAKKDHAQLQTEGNRIRKAAQVMADKGLPAIAERYEALALSHDLKDEREACVAAADAAMAQAVAVIAQVQAIPAIEVQELAIVCEGEASEGQAANILPGDRVQIEIARIKQSFPKDKYGQFTPAGRRMIDTLNGINDDSGYRPFITEVIDGEVEISSSYFGDGMKSLRVPLASVISKTSTVSSSNTPIAPVQSAQPAIEIVAKTETFCHTLIEEVFYSTPIMKIGRHEWITQVFQSADYGRCTRSLWRYTDGEAAKEYTQQYPDYLSPKTFTALKGVWHSHRQWPSYDSNNGANSGLPKTVAKLYYDNESAIQAALIEPGTPAAEPIQPTAQAGSPASQPADTNPLCDGKQAPTPSVTEFLPEVPAIEQKPAKLPDIIEVIRNDGQPHRCPTGNKQKAAGKSGAWTAELYKNAAGTFVLQFMGLICGLSWTFYSTAGERIRALQVMARDADTPAPVAPAEALKAPAAPAEDSTSPAPVNPPADRGVGGVARSNLESSPAFARCKPFNFDPRELLTDGVTAGQLVGLGVKYTGNMANPSGEGAITEVNDTRGEKWGALRITCTLEDGRTVNAEPHYFTASLRPILQFNSKHHGTPYLAELAAAAMLKKSSESSAAELASQAHAKALAALPLEFPHLKQYEQGGKLTGCTLAAANMRAMFKQAFPGVKFSVKSSSFSMGNSITITWIDGPTSAQVVAITDRFSGGDFDSMTDSYEYSSTAFTSLFGKSKYIHTRRELSDSLIQAAIDKHYEGQDDKPSLADYRNHAGRLCWSSYHVDSDLHWFNETLKSMTL